MPGMIVSMRPVMMFVRTPRIEPVMSARKKTSATAMFVPKRSGRISWSPS